VHTSEKNQPIQYLPSFQIRLKKITTQQAWNDDWPSVKSVLWRQTVLSSDCPLSHLQETTTHNAWYAGKMARKNKSFGTGYAKKRRWKNGDQTTMHGLTEIVTEEKRCTERCVISLLWAECCSWDHSLLAHNEQQKFEGPCARARDIQSRNHRHDMAFQMMYSERTKIRKRHYKASLPTEWDSNKIVDATDLANKRLWRGKGQTKKMDRGQTALRQLKGSKAALQLARHLR